MEGLAGFNYLILWVGIGVVMGVLIRYSVPRSRRRSLLASILAGIIGAVSGGLVGTLLANLGLIGLGISLGLMVILGAVIFSVISFLNRRSFRFNNLVYYNQVTSRHFKYPKSMRENDGLSKTFGRFIDILDYPISKRDLIRFAEDQNASRKVLSILESIEDHIYDGKKQLEKEISKVQKTFSN